MDRVRAQELSDQLIAISKELSGIDFCNTSSRYANNAARHAEEAAGWVEDFRDRM